jgi:hypothetical protein
VGERDAVKMLRVGSAVSWIGLDLRIQSWARSSPARTVFMWPNHLNIYPFFFKKYVQFEVFSLERKTFQQPSWKWRKIYWKKKLTDMLAKNKIYLSPRRRASVIERKQS